jgi:hypothetical protein
MSRSLSPAAQAVWDAFNDVAERVGVFDDYGDALAAAFRAAADHLGPDRRQLAAIAAELEGAND